MKNILPVRATLALVLGAWSLSAAGRSSTGSAPAPAVDKFDVAVNFTYKVAKIASTTDHFILPGGALDAAYNFGGKAGGLGLVVDLNGKTKSNIEPGVNLTQFSVMGGAHYTFHVSVHSPHAVDLYGEFLGGEVFASNSLFPGPSSTTISASSGAIQAGGGANIRLTHALALRLIQADFITTQLPQLHQQPAVRSPTRERRGLPLLGCPGGNAGRLSELDILLGATPRSELKFEERIIDKPTCELLEVA